MGGDFCSRDARFTGHFEGWFTFHATSLCLGEQFETAETANMNGKFPGTNKAPKVDAGIADARSFGLSRRSE